MTEMNQTRRNLLKSTAAVQLRSLFTNMALHLPSLPKEQTKTRSLASIRLYVKQRIPKKSPALLP